ncbi:MAG: DUF1572 domain-containing protein [Pedobacter sp.]|nr:MAG: DUF1572 domain-containing protein [Pedobacter sp.]
MITKTLSILFKRDLLRLREEISSYQVDANIWKVSETISNSGGNLCLHLVGNLNTYIGKELGKTNYVRNRELEFSLKNVPRTELIAMIDDTTDVVISALNALRPEDLQLDFPVLVLERVTTTEYMLIHLASHLNYHMGQINYHRRLLDVNN